MRIIFAVLLVGVSPNALRCHAAGPNTNLPYAETFEGYANLTPLVEGIGGWYADSDRAIVQTNTVQSGTNAAMIPIDVTLSNRFEDLPVTNVWLQMYVAPVLYDSEDDPPVATNAAAMLYINSNGCFMVDDAVAPATNWVAILNTVTGEEVVPVSNNWVRLDLYQNYSDKTWTLFADYVLLKEDILFVNPDNARFSGFDFYNGGGGTSYLDNIAVTVSNPPELGANGGNWLPALNVSETNFSRSIPQGQTAIAQTFDVWKTGGYYALTFTNTVTYDEPDYSGWISLDVSSGTSTGERRTVTVNYLASNLLARTEPYTASIRIDACDSRFGFTAKQSGWVIEVSMRVLAGFALSVDPTALSQNVNKGSNPTNKSFLVWNDSPPPRCQMDFTLTEDVSWLSLSTYSGVSTGDQQLIRVMFADMSALDSGTNTGTIVVKATADTGEGQGLTTQIQNVAVSVVIEGPPAPTVVTASDGTDTEKVIVAWNAVSGISRYEVWRGDTFDLDYALQIAEVTTTNYSDRSASPGALYYFWVKSVSDYGVRGDASQSDAGYRGLAAPGGLFASAGSYTNKVRVTWSASTGADSYDLYRGVEGQSQTNVFHAKGLTYDDLQVSPGVKYAYRVKAMNSRYSSAMSEEDVGYVLSPPINLSATQGTMEQKVLLTWSAADSATGYEIWRGDANLSSKASLLAKTTETNYTDSDVTAGTVYYYWLKSRNSTATSGLSESKSGYAASGSVDIVPRNLVILPGSVITSGSPSVVSFRIGNEGSKAMESPDTAIGISFYASTVPSFGDDKVLIGRTTKDISLSVGQTSAVIVTATNLVMPAVEGDYYIFVQVEPVYPSTLVDSDPDNNMTMRENPVHVDAIGGLSSRAINDYDGDGISDLAVISDGLWYVRSVDGMAIAADVLWGGAGFTAATGDYDGDGVADMAVYASGMWFVRNVSGDIILWAEAWGGSGFEPVYGAFSGTNVAGIDLAVYNTQSGAWYVRDAEGKVVLWETYLGQSGYIPVPGDFDGDGIWDIAVYHESTGAWYIRTVGGQLLVWAEYWGGAGFEPVMGDYDGDGAWDMAVYNEPTGMWFIRTLSGNLVMWGQSWGGPGFVPVFGDFTGNGVSDLAVYNEASGKWFIVSPDGELVLWDSLWGGPGYKPVGR